MKTIFTVCVLLLSLQAQADAPPTELGVKFNKIYVADGFDSNDNVQIVGEGMFANSCYRHVTTNVDVNEDKKLITLGPVAYLYNGLCLQVILPFQRVVDIGILKAGTYTIEQQGARLPLGKIKIRDSKTDAPDDYLYAPISQAFFQSRPLGSKVFLIGNFPLSCMKMKTVKTTIQKNVLIVQPVVEMDKSVPCTNGSFLFEEAVDLGYVPAGRYLLHVRSMNGNSINSLVDAI